MRKADKIQIKKFEVKDCGCPTLSKIYDCWQTLFILTRIKNSDWKQTKLLENITSKKIIKVIDLRSKILVIIMVFLTNFDPK